MTSPYRPVTGIDHGVSKGTLIRAGLVFAGHLDIRRLREAAEGLINLYPELKIVVKRKLTSLGKFTTPPATRAAWDFKSRDWRHKSLAVLFPPATAEVRDTILSSKDITDQGEVDTDALAGLFNFETQSVVTLGLTASPILMFRATLLGDEAASYTALGVVVPHVVMDGQGIASVIEAWGRLYRGESLAEREGDTHPDIGQLLGPATNTENPVNEEERPDRQLRYTSMDGLRYIKDCYRNSSRGVEEHYIHIPGNILDTIRDDARRVQERPLLVSKMDGLCAVVLRLFAGSTLASENQPMDLYHAYTFFSLAPEGSIPSPYFHNFYTFGRFPLPAASDITSEPLPHLATRVRERLNALRTVPNFRLQVQFHDEHQGAIVLPPRWDARHGMAMVSSWKDIEERTRAGFEGENLVFIRPDLQFPFKLRVPNVAMPFGDGHGGLWCRISTIKGDWGRMWQNAALGSVFYEET